VERGLCEGSDGFAGKSQITSNQVLSWNQILVEAYQAVGREPNVVHIPSDFIVAYNPDQLGSLTGDKVNSVVFDNGKIKRFVPNFSCEVNWAEGIRRSLLWFEEHASRQTIDNEMNVKWDKIIEAYEKALPNGGRV
jgi:hypothetical protein